MKKILFLVAGVAALGLTSCQQEAPADNSQERIDSMVNARVEEIRAQMMAENDRIIDSLAMVRADSMLAAAKGTKVKAPTKAPVKPTRTVANPNEVSQQTVKGNVPGKMNGEPAPTGKVNGSEGQPTGKNNATQELNGAPTGKRR